MYRLVQLNTAGFNPGVNELMIRVAPDVIKHIQVIQAFTSE